MLNPKIIGHIHDLIWTSHQTNSRESGSIYEMRWFYHSRPVG